MHRSCAERLLPQHPGSSPVEVVNAVTAMPRPYNDVRKLQTKIQTQHRVHPLVSTGHGQTDSPGSGTGRPHDQDKLDRRGACV